MAVQVSPVKKDDSQDNMIMEIGGGVLKNYLGGMIGKSAPSGTSNPRDRYMYTMADNSDKTRTT